MWTQKYQACIACRFKRIRHALHVDSTVPGMWTDYCGLKNTLLDSKVPGMPAEHRERNRHCGGIGFSHRKHSVFHHPSLEASIHQPSMIGPQIAKAHPAGMK